MKRTLNILIIEDSPNDEELLLIALRNAGYNFTHERVDNGKAMALALERDPKRDFILSDYSLPQFSAPLALTILKQSGLDIPFIIISGTIGEQRAMSTMREGAKDFILKDNLMRLAPIMERELREAESRRLKRKVEQAYKTSEQLYKTIVNTAREGIWLFDADGKTSFANNYLSDMLGYHEQELMGRKLTEFVEKNFSTKVESFFLRRILGSSEQIDLRLVKQNGSYIDVLVSATSMTNNGMFQGYLAMLSDVTDRKRVDAERANLLRELQQAVRIRDEFMSIASHELRTPLTSLKLETQLQQLAIVQGMKEHFEPNNLKLVFENYARHIDRLTRLVDDMLDIARINTGKLTMDFERFCLRDLVYEVVARYKSQTDAANIEVSIESPAPLIGSWDRFRIEQVLANLLNNAIKYGEGKPIQISTERRGVIAKMSVKDQGMGIPSEIQKDIFERYERGVSANEVSGLGLGLFIARQIVEMHGGRITVNSTVGKGSAFIVELPAET